MKGGAATGEWEATYQAPERVTLVAGPRLAPVILGAVIGAVFSNLVLKTTTFDAWPSALVGAAIGVVFAALVWLAKLDRLELDPKGFVEIAIGRRGEHTPWSDCTMFMPGEPQQRRWYFVGYNRYSSGYLKPAAATAYALSSLYGLPREQLINLMNAFRARAAGVAT